MVYVETDKGSGTAFFVTEDGYAVTCAHVVNGATELYVKINGEGEPIVEKAKIVKISSKADIALIKVEGKGYKYLDVDFELNGVKLGNDIAILGYPFGRIIADDVMSLGVSLCKGYVSSRQTKGGIKYVMLDVDVKAGYSGSPVIDCASGQVIGILCGAITPDGNSAGGVDFMLPLTYITEISE